jgi:hypothetical protein
MASGAERENEPRKTASEATQLLAGVEEVVAPVHGGAEGLLALDPSSSADEEREAIAQGFEDLGKRQDHDLGDLLTAERAAG